MSEEQIRAAEPVTNTVHNLIQTLSVKLDSAARYGLYEEDARKDQCEDCVGAFQRVADLEGQAIQELIRHLQVHIQREQA